MSGNEILILLCYKTLKLKY
jgi:hypothetical protein